MKKLRKALSILLTLCLIASFGFAAVAAGPDSGAGLKAGAGNGVITQ